MLIPASSTNFGHQRRLGRDKVNSKMKFKWDSDMRSLLNTCFITLLTWNNKGVIFIGTQL